MKYITFITTYSLDEPVIKNRLSPFIVEALHRGFSVNLINPKGGSLDIPRAWSFSHRPVLAPQANRGNFFFRTFREWRLAGKLINQLPETDESIVFITIPSMFLLFRARRIKARRRFLDIRDMTWEYLSDNTLIMRLAKNLFRQFAKRSISWFELISTTNASEYKYLHQEMGVDKESLILVTNGISRAQFDSVKPGHSAKISKGHRPLISYVGNVGMAQNLVTLLKTAARMPHVDFKIIGGGSDFERVSSVLESLGLSNVDMTGRVEWSDIPPIYHRSDVLYAQLTSDFSGAMPSKLYEYLATGKPVVYGGCGQALEILSEFEMVRAVKPDDPQELAEAFQQIIDAEVYDQLSMSNVERVARKFIREDSVISYFDKVMQNE